jgi:hypothetical protein
MIAVMSEPGEARDPDASGAPWLRRPWENWWSRVAVPALIIFGGMFVGRMLFGDADGVAIVYGSSAALAVVGLVIGLIKAKRN